MRLRQKLFSIYFLTTFILLLLTASFFGWLKYKDAKQELHRIAYYFSRTLSISIFNALLNDRHDLIQSEINEISQQREIQYAAVMDNNGFILSSNAKNNEDIEIRPFSDKILTVNAPSMLSILDKKEIFTEFVFPVEVGGKKWATIIVGFNRMLWLERRNDLIVRIVVSFIVFVLLTLTIGFILLRSLTKPLDEMMMYINSLDLSALNISHEEISLKREEEEEFKFLADLFQEFVSSLSEYADQLFQSREHLRATITSMQDLLVVLDWKLDIQDIYHEELIIQKESDLIGKNFDAVFPLSVTENVSKLKDVAEKTGLPQVFSFNMNTREEKKSFEAILTVRLNSDNNPEGFLLIIRDKSAEVLARKERDNMQQQVFHSSKLAAIGELAAGIAHEINNPLAVIHGYLELIDADVKDNKLPEKESIDALHISVERIQNIVQGFRDYSRADKDQKEDFDIHVVINKNVSILKGIFMKSSIRFKVSLNAQNCIVHANKSRFQQALMNILNNARDALESTHEPLISIETVNRDNTISILIKDNGPGIPEEIQSRIFDTFFTTKELGKGTGLGLSIAHSIIDAMKGNISLNSVLGEGTEFDIKLPLRIINKKKKADEIPEKKIKAIAGKSEHSELVLVVDDEEAIRKLLSLTLKREGFKVIEAANGQEALEKFDDKKADVIITDLRMPVMDGEALMKELVRREFPRNKILAVSGDIGTAKKDQLDKIKGHCYKILRKPFNNKILINEVNFMIKSSL